MEILSEPVTVAPPNAPTPVRPETAAGAAPGAGGDASPQEPLLEIMPWLAKYGGRRELGPGHSYPIAKRCLDLTLVALAAPILVPLLLCCALAIKVEDPRAPVLFRQLRTGRAGRRFLMLKLRTMVPDAEHRKQALTGLSERRWPDFKIRDDPRVTRVGKWLRRTSLDELPQVWNVVRGEMTLVGPRPTSFAADTYADWQRARLATPPGVTGLWQISRRGSSEFDERVRIDLAYIERSCLLLDLEILARTVPVLLRGDKGGW